MEKITNRTHIYSIVGNFFIIFLAFLFSSFFTECYALVFNIFPNGALPTSVPPGSSSAASYIVKNNTGQVRNNNFVKYLPPNVSVAPGGCANNFNLAPKGHTGDSCALNLNITGPVNGADPNPHHHLFVCFPGGVTCAGTNSPLNVKVVQLASIDISPDNATIPVAQTQQYTAIGHFIDGSTSNITTGVTWASSDTAVATIASTGLATATNVGTTNITAALNAITSDTAVLNVTAFVWVTNHAAGSNSVFFCPVNASGTLGACADTNAANIFTRPGFMNLNQANTIAYVANSNIGSVNGGSISICPINTNGTFGTCTIAATGTLSENFGIALNPAENFAYISEFNNNRVLVCPVDLAGALSTCVTAGIGFNNPFDIAFNPAGTIAFIVNRGNGSVSRCPINANVNGTFGVCSNAGATGLVNPQGIALNNAGTRAWISDDGNNNIITCAVDAAGAFSGCVPANTGTFSDPVAIVLNFTETLAYVAEFAGNAIYRCPINPDGTFSSCINTIASGGSNPFGLAINK